MNTPRRPLLTALLAASALGTTTLAQHTITVDDDRLQIADAMFTDLGSALAHLHSDFNPELHHATILLAPGRYHLVETLEMPVGGFAGTGSTSGDVMNLVETLEMPVGGFAGTGLTSADVMNLVETLEMPVGGFAGTGLTSADVTNLVETLEMPVGGFRLTIKGIGERPRINLGSTRIGIAVAGGELVLEGLQLESRASGDVEHPSVAVACHAGRLRIDDCVFRQMNPAREAGIGVMASCSTVQISRSSFLRYSDAGVALKHQTVATIQQSLFRKCLDGLRITTNDPRTCIVDVLGCEFDRNTVGMYLESNESGDSNHGLETLLFLIQLAMSPLSATDIMGRGFALNVVNTSFDSLDADVWNPHDATWNLSFE